MSTGQFVVFEGLDGSGQSTQIKKLAERLEKEGYTVHATKEPTLGEMGKLIRKALEKEWHPSNRTLQLLYAADRSYHLESEILPALERGEIVLCDRYFYSSYAYGSLNLDVSWIVAISSDFQVPDAVFYLEVKPETAVVRIAKRGNKRDLFEEKEKLTKISETYLKLSEEQDVFHVVDGEAPIEEVHEKIYELWQAEFAPDLSDR